MDKEKKGSPLVNRKKRKLNTQKMPMVMLFMMPMVRLFMMPMVRLFMMPMVRLFMMPMLRLFMMSMVIPSGVKFVCLNMHIPLHSVCNLKF